MFPVSGIPPVAVGENMLARRMLLSGNMGDEAERRETLGLELERILESVLFNLEHGIPLAIVRSLEQIADELSGLCGRDSALFDELRKFHSAVAHLFREPEAAGDLLVHGTRLVKSLVSRTS